MTVGGVFEKERIHTLHSCKRERNVHDRNSKEDLQFAFQVANRYTARSSTQLYWNIYTQLVHTLRLSQVHIHSYDHTYTLTGTSTYTRT